MSIIKTRYRDHVVGYGARMITLVYDANDISRNEDIEELGWRWQESLTNLVVQLQCTIHK
jgi:hypothetical protein